VFFESTTILFQRIGIWRHTKYSGSFRTYVRRREEEEEEEEEEELIKEEEEEEENEYRCANESSQSIDAKHN